MSTHGKLDFNRILDLICIGVLLVCGFLAIVIPNDNDPFKIRDSARLYDYSRGWKTKDGTEISLSEVGTLSKERAKGGKSGKEKDGRLKLAIHNVLPTVVKYDSFLNFRAKHTRLSVKIGKRTVYTFDPKRHYIFSKGTGIVFHAVRITEENAGRPVSIEFYPDYTDGSNVIDDVYIGRTSDFYGLILDDKAGGFILCLLSVIVGVLLLIASAMGRQQQRFGYRLRVLGLLAVCVGLWSLFETQIIQLLFGFSPAVHEMGYLLLTFIPFFLVSFVDFSMERKSVMPTKISFGIVMSVLAVCVFSTIFANRDFHRMLWLIHLSLIVNVGIAIYVMVDSYFSCFRNKVKCRRKAAPIAISVYLLLSLVDIIRYQFDKGVNDAGAFMRTGIFLAVLILSGDLIKSLIDEIKNTEHMDIMAKLAYTDALTGLPNRTAFEEKEKEIEIDLLSGAIKEVMICQLDLNYLKLVNDNYGHANGDRHIMACAKIIKEVFGDIGYVFRVGGDEFTVFCTEDVRLIDFQAKIKMLQKIEDEYNNNSNMPVPLHMAIGYVYYSKEDFNSIREAEMEADRRMYDYKEAMKKKGDWI